MNVKQLLCLYCNDVSKWDKSIKENQLCLYLVDGEINAVINIDGNIVAFDIDYCPYCGRKLNG